MMFSIKPHNPRDNVPCKRWRRFLRLEHLVSIEERSESGSRTKFL